MDRSQSGQIATLDMESPFLEFTADYTGEDDHEILTIDEMTIRIDMGSGRVTGTASGGLMRQHYGWPELRRAGWDVTATTAGDFDAVTQTADMRLAVETERRSGTLNTNWTGLQLNVSEDGS
jgi:hypothetical protein